MEHLKPLLPAGGDASELEAAAQALAGLSPEDRDLLAAVQESPYRLTTLEQPAKEIGRATVSQLFRRIEKKEIREEMIFEGNLIVRESTSQYQ